MPHIADGRAMGERAFYLENEDIKDHSPSFYYSFDNSGRIYFHIVPQYCCPLY